MRKTLIGVGLGLALLVAACANKGDKGISPAESVLFGCKAYDSALAQVTSLNEQGKLKDSHVKIVDGVRATLNPLCLGPAPDVEASVKDIAVDSGVKSLNAILAVVF